METRPKKRYATVFHPEIQYIFSGPVEWPPRIVDYPCEVVSPEAIDEKEMEERAASLGMWYVPPPWRTPAEERRLREFQKVEDESRQVGFRKEVSETSTIKA